jgi:acylphosphatase
MTTKCIRAFVSGRVQGVFFRASTRHEALRLGVSGHAINLPDGRVEVLACGNSAAVDQLAGWLGHGPDMARVDKLDVTTVSIPAPSGFAIG